MVGIKGKPAHKDKPILTTVKLSPDLRHWLDGYAARHGWTLRFVIVKALRALAEAGE
jgi:hypothetical protein